MEKAITTSMLIIASVVASLALINAVFPAMGRSSGALVTANEAASSLLEQRMEAYRRALLDVLIELLEPLSVSKKVMTAIRLRLEDVDQEAGVSL